MTPRAGTVCIACGYPADESLLCEACTEWQPIAAAAEVAMQALEQRTARAAARKADVSLLTPAVSLFQERK
jgi:cellobiose-specific phosphotransferase system component IIB